MIDYHEEWLIAVKYIASIGKHEEFSEIRNVKHLAQLEKIKAQLEHNHIDMILRGCGDWILVETEQTSRSSGIISKADNKGKCLSTSKEYEYLVGNTVYFDNTGTKYQMIGNLTVVPFSRIYAYEVEE